MDFKTKRRTKKLARLCYTLSYVMLTIFVAITIISLVFGQEKINASGILLKIMIILTAIISLVSSLILMSMAMEYTNKRRKYLHQIKIRRQNRFFLIILTYFLGDEFEKANKIYDMVDESTRKMFLNGLFIGMQLRSSNPEDVKEAYGCIANILKTTKENL